MDVLRKTVGKREAESSMKEIMESFTGKSAPWLSFGSLVIIISILLAAFQQFIGINVVLYYAPKIFQNPGTRLDVSLLQTILVGAVNVVFTIIAIVTVDKLGRKTTADGWWPDNGICHGCDRVYILFGKHECCGVDFCSDLYSRICHELGTGNVGGFI